MRVLVTGAAGFLGRQVVGDLLDQGHQVVALDQRPVADGNATTVVADVRDGKRLMQVGERHGIEAVIHLASPLMDRAEADPALGVSVIAGGMVSALELCRARTIRLVWASSIAVFGGSDAPVTDEATHRPLGVYGTAKSFCEALAHHYGRRGWCASLGLRFPVVYGWGRVDGPTAFLGRLIAQESADPPVQVPRGDLRMCFQHVADTARYLIRGLTVPLEGSRTLNTPGDTKEVMQAVRLVQAVRPGARVLSTDAMVELAWDIRCEGLEQLFGPVQALSLPLGIRHSLASHARDDKGRSVPDESMRGG